MSDGTVKLSDGTVKLTISGVPTGVNEPITIYRQPIVRSDGKPGTEHIRTTVYPNGDEEVHIRRFAPGSQHAPKWDGCAKEDGDDE